VEDRGLVVSTVVGYVGVARRFLSERASAAGDEPGVAGMCAGVVTAFLLRECGRLGSGTSPPPDDPGQGPLDQRRVGGSGTASRSAILASASLRSQSLGMVSATARARSISAAAWAGR
jgi:hypothetical protein